MATESSSTKSKKDMMTPILVVLLIGAVVVISIMWQRLQASEDGTTQARGGTEETQKAGQPEEPTVGEVAPVTDSDHVRGSEDAAVTWIEYSDLECPFCARIHPDLVQLLDEYDGQVRWVYRHFPLDQLHPQARILAQGSECAADISGEDTFWEYVDYVFENTSTDPSQVASALGIPAGEFETCLESDEIAQRIDDDYQTGIDAGVSGTPGNIIIGPDGQQELIPGALPYEQLKAVVDGML